MLAVLARARLAGLALARGLNYLAAEGSCQHAVSDPCLRSWPI